MKLKFSLSFLSLILLMMSSCGIYQRKYTHGHYWSGLNQQEYLYKIEKQSESESEKQCQSQNVKERWDTIVPLPLPVEKKDSIVVDSSTPVRKEINPDYDYVRPVKPSTQYALDEDQISKQIDKTFKADYFTLGLPFLGWGILRLALINGSFYSIDQNFLLIFFTLAMLLSLAYILTFILSLVWGFETQGKIERYFKNHSLYNHWKQRNSWSIILAFLGLLSPIISFILFLVSLGA